MPKRAAIVYLSLIFALLALVAGWYIASFFNREPDPLIFDSSRAYADVQTQVAFGPRTPGSVGHTKIREWLTAELYAAGWTVEVHESVRMGHPIFNIIAKRNDDTPQIILGAHYDTRFFADNDPDPTRQTQAPLGANDGASGVAVLLELARSLPKDAIPVWLVFFDTEDNGRIEGWDWILGSRAFVEEILIRPEAVVIVDMIGDADLNIYFEQSSNPVIRAEIWSTAERLGYASQFIPEEKYNMIDDHTPFLEAGIPAVDIIDFDYPYYHTTQDTLDKVSAESLKAVGETLWHWIAEK
ncbi:MAG: M28 family peptidase [Chloroflexi bacterium]|nr:M28 family peptidase [Chloroflexota bacterium]